MPLVLALAWGCIAAVPWARAARARPGRARISSLRRPADAPQPRRLVRATWRFGIVERWRVRRAAARTRAAVLAELPVTVDLLAVAVGAGYTPFLAVEVAAPWAPPVLRDRLQGVVSSCRLGADFDRTLDDLSREHDDLRPLTDALLAADRLGAPVLDALQRLAVSARADVRRRAEAHARTVPVRLLFPLVFLVLPAFGILTVVPTVVERFAG
jgi:tight adherence protein C